jgi:Na+/melibiose symporter-like transporter
MFSANPEWSQTQLFLWLVATNVFFWSGNTMVMVPHAAFASEATETHGERISVMGWREGFMTIGLLAGGTAMFFLLENAVDRATDAAVLSGLTGDAVAEAARIARGEAHGTITMWFGVYVCALATVSFLGTREPSKARTPLSACSLSRSSSARSQTGSRRRWRSSRSKSGGASRVRIPVSS